MQRSFKILKLVLILVIGSLFIIGSGDDDDNPTKVFEGEIDDSPAVKNTYFEGIWKGNAKSSRNKAWAMKITLDSKKKLYKINYLHIQCGGKLIIRSSERQTITFQEKLDYGDCTNGNKIIFTKVNENEVTAEWYSTSGDKKATGTLKRDAPNDSNPLQVYPKYPIISTEGDLQITTVLSTSKGVKESTDENELFVSYKVANEEIVSVTSSGYLVANGPVGTTKVTVSMTDSKNKKLGSRDIEVEVAELDVKKIVLSPDISLLAKGENQIFSITGINGQGPTEVEDSKLSFTYDSNKLELTDSVKAIVTATAKEKKGYVFLTPTYTDVGTTITGNSAVIEFHTKPNIATPGHVLAGKDADMIRIKNGTIDNLYIAHQREDSKEIILTGFNFKNTNPWSSSTVISSSSSTFVSPKLFTVNKVLNLISIEKKSDTRGDLILLKEESNGAWSDKRILIKDISLNAKSSIGLITIKNEILFTLNEDKKISIFKVENSKVKEIFAFDTTDSIQSLDITQNREEKLRLVVAEKGKLSYITSQEDTFYIQTISSSTSAKKVKLIYTKKNIPIVLYSTDSGLEKRNILSDGWSGATKINGTVFNKAEFLKNITAFDAVIDRFNNLKIAVIDDDELYYIKQYKDRSKKDAWRKTKIVTAHVGANSLSMKMDNKNRIKVVYRSLDESWIDYWAEPQFFKYRDKKTIYDNEDDELDENTEGTIILQRGNLKPIAKAGSDISKTSIDKVILDASASKDSDGSITSYVWSEGATKLGTGVKLTLDALSVKKHIITLTITDNRGAIATDTVTVTVTRVPGYPIALVGDDRRVYADEEISLDGSKSSDSDGSIKSYVWSENGTTLGKGKVLKLENGLALGTHTIKLTVTDDKGNKDSVNIVIKSIFRDAIIGQNFIIKDNYGTIDIDSLIVNEKSGEYASNSGCRANIIYTSKETDWFVFNRTVTSGDCTTDCQMKVKKDGSTLQLVCEGSVNWTKGLTTQNSINAVKLIKNYSSSQNNQNPTVEDYLDGGVNGVDKNNLDAINKRIARVPYASYVDTSSEIQSYIDEVLTAHNKIKTYADDNTKSLPSVIDYENFGFYKIITGGNLVGINRFVDDSNSSGVDSFSKVKTFVNKVVAGVKIIYNYASSSNNQKPILQDYIDAGVIEVDVKNLEAVNKRIARVPYVSYVDTSTEIQSYIDNVLTAHNRIKAYANDNTKSLPSVNDYENFGFYKIITGGNLVGINRFVENTNSSGVDSFSKVKIFVDKVVIGVTIIYNYASSSNNQKPILQDYIDAGIIGVDKKNIDAVNKRIDSIPYSSYVDTSIEIQSYVDKVLTAHNRIKAYADDNTKSQPSVNDYENFGFKDIITGGNLTGINKFIDNTNSSGVDSFDKVKTFVDRVVNAIAIIKDYSYSQSNLLPTVSDYSDAGVTGVNSGNLDDVNKVVKDTSYTRVDSTSEIQSVVNSL